MKARRVLDALSTSAKRNITTTVPISSARRNITYQSARGKPCECRTSWTAQYQPPAIATRLASTDTVDHITTGKERHGRDATKQSASHENCHVNTCELSLGLVRCCQPRAGVAATSMLTVGQVNCRPGIPAIEMLLLRNGCLGEVYAQCINYMLIFDEATSLRACSDLLTSIATPCNTTAALRLTRPEHLVVHQ